MGIDSGMDMNTSNNSDKKNPVWMLMDPRGLCMGYYVSGSVILGDEERVTPSFRITLKLDLELESFRRAGKPGLSWSSLTEENREGLGAVVLSKKPS